MRLRVTGLLAAPVRLAAGASLVAVCLAAAACRRPPAPPTPPVSYAGVVSAPDRTDADRALDAGRHPAELLAFVGIRPGMRVAELGAGGGYTTELLARAVGPKGEVYGQNTPLILERFAEKPWSERLAQSGDGKRGPRRSRVRRPAAARTRATSTPSSSCSSTTTPYWMGVDRGAHEPRRVRAPAPRRRSTSSSITAAAPAPARPRSQTLHRIEEKIVRDEVERAGFKLVRTADFLRNPADPRDWNDSPRVAGERRGTSDRFVLKFEKP